ncbi:hypothetical protein [Halogranum amylolyticum]|nr:hypothetical protein [Halogranum amylolyticum]
MRHSQTPLTPREQAAFERLRGVVDEMNAGCQREAANTAVAETGFEADEAVQLVDRLLSKGYLYAVQDDVRIT